MAAGPKGVTFIGPGREGQSGTVVGQERDGGGTVIGPGVTSVPPTVCARRVSGGHTLDG